MIRGLRPPLRAKVMVTLRPPPVVVGVGLLGQQSLDLLGLGWICLDLLGLPGICLDSYGFPRICYVMVFAWIS